MNSVGRHGYSQHDCAEWTQETADMLALVRSSGVRKPPRSAQRNSAHIPGMICQPPRPVRVAYWWATALRAQGWRLFEVGEQIAGGGFIAETGLVGNESVWIIFPRHMPDDGTEASALVHQLQRLTFDQRDYFRRLLAAGSRAPDFAAPAQ